MSNDECPGKHEAPSTNDSETESAGLASTRSVGQLLRRFGLRASPFFRHSTFGIGHFRPHVVAWLALAILFSILLYSYTSGGIVAVMFAGGLSAEEKLLFLRERFHALGPAGPLAYVLLVTVEVVVAPLPGAMLYAPGGAIFGGFWGGLLALIGNVLGAGLSCRLVRLLGGQRLERLIQREAMNRYGDKLARHGVWVVFLLRINPLTSSDLVSYAAGLTPLRTWRLMLGTTLGMAPLCFAQAYLAEGVMQVLPAAIYPLLIGGVIYAVIAILVLRSLLTKRPQEFPAEAQ